MITDVDNLHVLFISQNFRDVKMLAINLLDDIFLLAREKMEDEYWL